jgi:hypothetical protein
MITTNEPEPYLSPIARTVLTVLSIDANLCVVRSQTRAWLSRPKQFRGASVPDGGFAQLVAYELLVPQLGATATFTTYRMSKRGRAWIAQYRESTMSIYHKNPTVYQMAWTSNLRNLYAEGQPFTSINGEVANLNLFIEDDGGAWILAHTLAEVAGQTCYVMVFDYRTGAAVDYAELPQPAKIAVERFLEEHGHTYFEEARSDKGKDSTGTARQGEKPAKANRG